MGIEWNRIAGPVFLKGGKAIAFRDPCGHYHDGVFRVWHTQVHGEAGGNWVAATGVTESCDLVTWSPPRLITPMDERLNYSSPGNVIRHDGCWVMCLQTYPTPHISEFSWRGIAAGIPFSLTRKPGSGRWRTGG